MDQPAPTAPQPEQELLKWTAPSRPFHPRDRQFFTTAIVIVGLISLILAFAGEWMLIAVLASMVFAYYVWSTIPPEQVEYALTSRGIRAHGQLYRWHDMDRWWIDQKWQDKVLNIDTPMHFPRRLHLLLGQLDEEKVKEVMGRYVTMEKPEDTAMDRAGRWLSDKFPLTSG